METGERAHGLSRGIHEGGGLHQPAVFTRHAGFNQIGFELGFTGPAGGLELLDHPEPHVVPMAGVLGSWIAKADDKFQSCGPGEW
jgi:hypothetical protein